MSCQCGNCTCGKGGASAKPKIMIMGAASDPALEQTIKDEILDWMADPVSEKGDAAIAVIESDSRIASSLLPFIKSNVASVVVYGGSHRNGVGAAALEALGIGVAHTASTERDGINAVKHLMIRLEKGIGTRDLLTPRAFQKAIQTVKAQGGSNEVIKQLEILAREAGVKLKQSN